MTALCVIVGCGAERTSQNGADRREFSTADAPAKELVTIRPGGNSVGSIDRRPFAPSEENDADVLFESLDPKSVGIEFFHYWTRRPGQLRNNTTGSGVAMGDYDGDRRVDVFLPRSTDGGRLYRNLGNFQFKDVTDEVGILGEGRWTTGATFVDIDNDGDLDLYVCGFDCPNHLYINDGRGRFSERSVNYGLDFKGSSVMMAFGDYDRDGDLDAYLVTNHVPPPEEIEYRLQLDRRGIPHVPEQYRQYHDTIRLPDGSYGIVEVGQYDHMYQNNGDGTFTDVSLSAGVAGNFKGLAATWWDYNHDGWPDLYVANDFYGPDHLYRNNQDGTFTDVAREVLPHTPWFSMGCDVGDVNGDGLLDLMGTDMASDTHYRANVTLSHIQHERWFLESPTPRQYMRNALYLVTGGERVMEAAFLTGMEATNWTWSVRFEDLDQDGWLDAYFTNGMSLDETNNDLKAQAQQLGPEGSDAYNDFWEKQGPLRERNLAFRNLGGLRFENASQVWGLDTLGVSFGAAFGDLDGDGDLDLVVNNFNDVVSIYRNNGKSGRAIAIQLVGNSSNRWGIGATVRAEVADRVIVRQLTHSRGFMSASDPTVHMGFGDASRIDRLEVEWPSGHVQSFENVETNCFYTITEPTGPPTAKKVPSSTPLFAQSDRIVAVQHDEAPFDDLQRQPLLGWRHSRLGPGMAVGDVDGDGHDDLFVGGAAKDWGSLLFNHGDGRWKHSEELFPAWNADSPSEDLGALLVDVESDGDLDLYIVSGGVEHEPTDEALRDRLYLNDGNGDFTRATGHLPDLRDSGAVVAAADYDHDGDLDLLVGGRIVPGRYPLPPRNRLLKNEQGRFRDATEDDAPQLRATGLVTSALWTDVNDDGWIDLLVTHEWGPTRLFINGQGQLHDATEDAGLAEARGWWNGIAGRDLDGDGDIDYVVTNLGRNTVYRVSPERPARLYYGDFAGTGQRQLLEGKYDEQGRLVPAQTKPIVEEVLNFVEAAFPKYHDYASATLVDVVSEKSLKESLQLTANTAESVILRNDGEGRFTIEPLPVLAQIAPGYGVVLSDFNGDGYTDAVIAQNSYAPRGELGHFDGGVSLLLLGDKDGDLIDILPAQSGIIVPGDAKSVVVVDLDGDVWPDLVVGVNNGQIRAFENQGSQGSMIAIRLTGRGGNPTAIGARVTLSYPGGPRQTAEVSAGGGYLSQSAPVLYFGLGNPPPEKATAYVRWPDGRTSQHEVRPSKSAITLTQS